MFSQVKVMSKESPVITLRNLIDQEIYDLRSNLAGKVFTVVDASISDLEQRNGIKSLIKEVFYNNESYYKWVPYRIGRMLKEFNDKFAHLPLTPDDAKWLETGERATPKEMACPSSQNYFSEDK